MNDSKTNEIKIILRALGSNLIRERNRRGLTQKELACAAGIPQSTLAYAECGIGNPSVKTVYRLSKFYSIPMDELMREAPSDFVLGERSDLLRRSLPSGTQIEEAKLRENTVRYKVFSVPCGRSVRIPEGEPTSKEVWICHEGELWIRTNYETKLLRKNQSLEVSAHLSKKVESCHEKQNARFTVFRFQV